MNQDERPIQIFAIYQNPKDFPADCYVVRVWNAINGKEEPGDIIYASNDLEYCRDHMRRLGLTCMLPAMPEDDPVIVETWI